jgi:hypothetical protein
VSQDPPPPEDRRFVNNPFARALHPEKPRRTVGQWLALVLVSLFAFVVMGAAFLLPLLFAHGLLVRAHGRWGMIAAGVLVAAVYGLLALRLLRRKR